MDFVRRNLFFVICILVAAGAVALGVTGLQRMPAVGEEMRNVERIYQSLSSLRAVSLQGLEAQQERIDTLVSDRGEVFAKARELYGYEQLVPNVFPNGDANVSIEFRRRYREAMQALFESLKSTEPPDARDISFWQDEIKNEEASEADRRLERGLAAAPDSEGPHRTPGGVLTKAGARYNPQARAAMAKAQRAYCYAVHDSRRTTAQLPSLEFSDAMGDTQNLEAPSLEFIWYAQIGYWIQKDFVEAIVAVNEEAAAELDAKGESAWIGVLPVKEVISIRILEGFVPRDGEELYGSRPDQVEAALPPGTPETVFTHSGSASWYDVLQYSVKLVMDVRDIPKLIERLSTNSFHTLLRVSYMEVPPNRSMRGKIYGSEPTVKVVMDFETILLGEVFRPLMPEVICEDYEINCPSHDDDG